MLQKLPKRSLVFPRKSDGEIIQGEISYMVDHPDGTEEQQRAAISARLREEEARLLGEDKLKPEDLPITAAGGISLLW